MALFFCGLGLTGCDTLQNRSDHVIGGMLGGGIAGGVVGSFCCGDPVHGIPAGILIGAAAGGVGGLFWPTTNTPIPAPNNPPGPPIPSPPPEPDARVKPQGDTQIQLQQQPGRPAPQQIILEKQQPLPTQLAPLPQPQQAPQRFVPAEQYR